MNRIANAIDKMAETIASKGLPEQKLKDFHKALDISFGEFYTFNNVRAMAQACNKISYEESMTAWGYMGSVDIFNRAPLHVKYVLTQFLKELLDWRIKNKQNAQTA